MAAKTPSKGIDQNGDGKFIDKYWGRVPQFLKWIPEAYICVPNPEYIELMQAYIDGDITEKNLSPELYTEIEKIILNLGCPCLLTGKERAIMNAFLGNESCPAPSHKLTCSETICCNSIVMCSSPSICEDDDVEPPEPPAPCDGYSTYDLVPGRDDSSGEDEPLYGYFSSNYGESAMGSLTLIDGPELYIQRLTSVALFGEEELYAYFKIGSNGSCNGQSAIEIQCVELDNTWAMVSSNPGNSDYEAEGSVQGILGFAKVGEGNTVRIRIKRHNCDQCNIQVTG